MPKKLIATIPTGFGDSILKEWALECKKIGAKKNEPIPHPHPNPDYPQKHV